MKIGWYITNYITFPPANSLWTNRGEGGAEDILQVQGLSIDGLNNSEDTTIYNKYNKLTENKAST